MLKGKKIIIGISGGIAAYKTPFLIRLFKKAGAEVRVVVTKNALEFVTKATLETLSQNKVYCDVFSNDNDYTTEHVSLTDWGDLFIIAPATANIIGKFAHGIADDALSTSLLAFNKPVFFAPSMNDKMFSNFAVQQNIVFLKKNNIRIIEPAEGFLACGTEGKGRMEEPETIFFFGSELSEKKRTACG
ncbi:MAG: bifunctional phosphopantothenoylcysteine decarboxylase/phosphopantothenate--cysteine ligase CoaBC [Bacteroidota bacterium]